MSEPSNLAKRIVVALYEAGRVGAIRIGRLGGPMISFPVWVDQQLAVDPLRVDLVGSLKEMVACYGSDDRRGPIPIIERARGAIAQAERAGIKPLTDRSAT